MALQEAIRPAREPRDEPSGLSSFQTISKSSMFHPRRILKLGNGIWVWMDRATVTDLLEWGRQSTKNVARVKTADADRQSYVAERVDAFRGHFGLVLLGDL